MLSIQLPTAHYTSYHRIQAVDPDTADNNGQVADVADTAKDSAATGDTTRVFLYVLETLMAAVLVAGLVVADVKKNRINR